MREPGRAGSFNLCRKNIGLGDPRSRHIAFSRQFFFIFNKACRKSIGLGDPRSRHIAFSRQFFFSFLTERPDVCCA